MQSETSRRIELTRRMSAVRNRPAHWDELAGQGPFVDLPEGPLLRPESTWSPHPQTITPRIITRPGDLITTLRALVCKARRGRCGSPRAPDTGSWLGISQAAVSKYRIQGEAAFRERQAQV